MSAFLSLLPSNRILIPLRCWEASVLHQCSAQEKWVGRELSLHVPAARWHCGATDVLVMSFFTLSKDIDLKMYPKAQFKRTQLLNHNSCMTASEHAMDMLWLLHVVQHIFSSYTLDRVTLRAVACLFTQQTQNNLFALLPVRFLSLASPMGNQCLWFLDFVLRQCVTPHLLTAAKSAGGGCGA